MDMRQEKPKKRWLKWFFIIILVLILGVVALFVINPSLPEGSDMLKKRALNELKGQAEDTFMTNGEVTTPGLCVFMSMNQSYRETVSDPSWEFQCFDSDDAFAAEVKLNNGTYRCIDSTDNTVNSNESVIYGPQCLEEGDTRLSDNAQFTTSFVFYESERVKQ